MKEIGTRLVFSVVGVAIGGLVAFIGAHGYVASNGTLTFQSHFQTVFQYWLVICVSFFGVVECVTKGEFVRSILALVVGLFGFETGLFHSENMEVPTYIIYVAALVIAVSWFTTSLVIQ